jgi:hypothetical protein
MPDFFGEQNVNAMGTASVGRPAGYDDPEAARKREEQRIYANYVRGLDANGNPLPAYGTPQSQGGTAQGYQVVQEGIGTKNMTRGGVSNNPVSSVIRGDLVPHTGQFAAGAGAGALSSRITGDLAVADSLAGQVTGAQPTVAPENRVTAANRDALTPVIDPMLERNAEVDRAFAMSEDLVNRILNAPSQTGLIADRMLSNQLAIGRSAPGGIGAAQGGVKAALGAAPQLQSQAAQQSIQEQQARAQAATGAAQIYAGVAGSTADRAVRIQEANQQAASNVLNNLTSLTGMDYSFDAAKMQSVGQLARDYFNNAQAFANMDTQRQIAQWEDLTKRYGIDASFKAAMEQIAAQENIGPLDAFKLVLGGVSAVGGFAGL